MNSEKKLIEKLDLILKDFTPDDEANSHWRDPSLMKRIAIPHEITPTPYVVFIIFVYFKKYSFGGHWEKVNWEIPLKFKGVPLMLSHRKFGFEVFSPPDIEINKESVIEAIQKIIKAIPVAEKLLEPHIRFLLDEGRVTIPNEYFNLRDRYNYFRENAIRFFEEIEERKEKWEKGLKDQFNKVSTGHQSNVTKEERNIIPNAAEIITFNDSLRYLYVASHNVTAMIDAYYSYLEHLLVLVKPFVHIDVVEHNLSSFIGMTWAEKFKSIFDLNSDSEAKRHYDALNDVKESYRNILAHGNFQKNGGSIFVHMKYLGAIPMHLSQSKKSLCYTFGSIPQKSFEEICNVFDSFDTFSENGPTRYGVMYAKRGLYLAFDNDSKKSYKEAMVSDNKFIIFLEYLSDVMDRSANMDW
jgi:hypothetical protein